MANAPSHGRRTFLAGTAGAAASALLSGCGGGGSGSSSAVSAPAAAPAATPAVVPVALANPQPTPAGAFLVGGAAVKTIGVGTIGQGFAGLSYEKAYLTVPAFSGANANLIALFKLLGPSLLRIGGNTVDKTVWTPTGAGLAPSTAAGWQVAPADIDRLAAFAAATGWQVLYGVNLATSTPAAAAAEAAYAAKALGAALSGFEIGNEPDNYAPFTAYPPPAGFSSWTVQAFISQWQLFRAAIAQAVPGAVFTGPACGNSVDTWTAPFAQAAGKQVALLTQHYYRSSGQLAGDTPATLVTPDTALQAELGQLKAVAQAANLPFRIDETNSYYAGGAAAGDWYAASLWTLDHLFAIAIAGGVGANFHGGGDKAGISPIADTKGAVIAVQPDYYGLLLFTLGGQGQLLQTGFAGGGLMSAYTIKTAAGYSVFMINKDPSQNLSLTLTLPGAVTSATAQVMTGPSLDASTGIAIQGSGVSVTGAFTPKAAYDLAVANGQVTAYVPALSAVLIKAA